MLTRNPDYWGEQLPFDEVEFRVLDRRNGAPERLDVGADRLRVPQPRRVGAAGRGRGVQRPEPFSVNWGGILFFDRDGALLPELGDVRVREALAIAIDSEALVDVGWEGLGEQTSQVFGPETAAYDEALDDAYAYDPERAKELLDDAGASDLTLTLPVSGVLRACHLRCDHPELAGHRCHGQSAPVGSR